MNTSKIKNEIKKYMDSYDKVWGFSGNILVSVKGQVIFQGAYGYANLEHGVKNKLSTKFNIASITKSFTAAAVVMLEERGELEIKDSISKYLPEYPEFSESITLHHLLSHSSGIKNYNEVEEFFEKLKKIYFTETEFINLFKDFPLEFEPGSKFSYSNSGYYILGLIIERVSGMKYEQFVEENIFSELKMNDTEFYREDKITQNRASGYEINGDRVINDSYSEWSKFAPTGGIITTLEDLLKWDRALYGNKILKDHSRDKLFQDYGFGYGYGWNIEKVKGMERIGHNGAHNGFISQMYRYPQEEVCIILMSNRRYTNIWDISECVEKIVFGEEIELPKREERIEIKSMEYSKFAGEYDDLDGDVFEVSYHKDGIYLRFGEDSKFEIYPIGENRFNHILIDEQYEFTEGGIKICGTVFPKKRK